MIIGTCSICGGPVETDMEGVGRCKRCHAKATRPWGPVIPMDPPMPPYPVYPCIPQSPPDWRNGSFIVSCSSFLKG
jgi:hypothetical protein